jgi:hypothetical protein
MEQTTIRSAFALANRIVNSAELIEKVKANPRDEIPRIADQVIRELPAIESDPWIYRIVVLSLGGTVLTVVIGAIILAIKNGSNGGIPEVLTAIGSAAVGALAGLLAPSPGKR